MRPRKTATAAAPRSTSAPPEVLSILALPLLALALGVPPKRSTSALGIFLAVIMIVAYHKVNEYAQAAGTQGRLDPSVAIWVPFAIFAGLVGWMFYTIALRPRRTTDRRARTGLRESDQGRAQAAAQPAQR